MQIRPIYAVGSVLILVAVGIFVWFALQPREMEPVDIYKTGTSETPVTPSAEQNEPVEATEAAVEKAEEVREEKSPAITAEESKEIVLSVMKAMGASDTDPRMDEFRKALESPEYEEYLRKQREIVGMDFTLWWDFLESKGLGSSRNLQNEKFDRYFPGGREASYYEPMMRRKFAALALEHPSAEVTDLMSLFWDDEANYIWTRQHFNGHVGDFDWGSDIMENAESILAETPPAATPSPPVATEETPINSLSEVSDAEGERVDDAVQPSAVREEPRLPASITPIEVTDEMLNPDIFTDLPDLVSGSDFERSFRESFSPERFGAAVSVLNRYGLEEGIRRLEGSDPQVAAYLQKAMRPRSEVPVDER